MRKLALIASAAAMAIAMPAIGQGKGKGGEGQGGGKPAAAKVGKPDRGPAVARGNGRDKGESGSAAEAKPDKGARPAKLEASAAKAKSGGPVDAKGRKAGGTVFGRDEIGRLDGPRQAAAGADCPPGLAKKNNGCLPPGQAKKIYGVGDRIAAGEFGAYNLPSAYGDLYQDSLGAYYRYDENGYIYRVDADTGLVEGLIPLLGGGLAPGQLLPTGYDIYNVPLQYRDLYYDSDDAWYRYGDNAIYQVDPQTRMIESVVALLAGDLAVGQTLPAGYDVYNVPLQYRDTYYDTDDAWYRYADGYVYEVDPTTRLIETAIQLLT